MVSKFLFNSRNILSYEVEIDEDHNDIVQKIIYGASVIIFLFDLTNQYSFEKLKNVIRTVISADKQNRIQKIIVGNKLDDDEKRVVSGYEVQTFIDNYNSIYPYIDVSLTTKENFSELEENLNKALESQAINSNEHCSVSLWSSNTLPPKGENSFEIYNIILIGDEGAGKTSFISSLFLQEIKIKSVDAFLYAKIKKDEIKIHIWDTAGFEKYNSIPTNYYQQADAVVVLYDVCNEDSIRKGEKWFKEAKEKLKSNIICFLIGNKIDSIDRQIQQIAGIQIAKENNMKYCEISAKYCINTKEVLNAILYDIYEAQNNEGKGYSLDSIGLIKDEKRHKCC